MPFLIFATTAWPSPVVQVSDTLTKVAWCDPEHGPLILVGSTHGTVHVLQGPCSTSRRWQWVGRLQCGKASIT